MTICPDNLHLTMPSSKNSTVVKYKKNFIQVFMLNFRLLDNISVRQQPLVHTNSSIYRSSFNSHKCMTAKNIQLYIFTFKLKVSGRKNAMQYEHCVETWKKKKRKIKIAFISGTTMIYDTFGWLITLTFLLLLLFLVPKSI